MRLDPDIQDGYRWSGLPEKAEKALSKLSIGPLEELCREVGRSFKAVAPQTADQSSNSTEASFSSLIEHLTQEKTRIQEESMQWQRTAKEEGESQRELHARYHEMQLSLSIAHERADSFENETNRLSNGHDLLKKVKRVCIVKHTLEAGVMDQTLDLSGKQFNDAMPLLETAVGSPLFSSIEVQNLDEDRHAFDLENATRAGRSVREYRR